MLTARQFWEVVLPDANTGHVLFSLAKKLSRYRKFVTGTGAVSRYKLSRSQKSVTVQELNWGQMRALPNVAERSWVSGCIYHYKAVLGAGAKAKTLTTVPAIAFFGRRNVVKVAAKAGQLTHIIRVRRGFLRIYSVINL